MSWMEERRYDWLALASSAIEKILEGQSILLVTDFDRAWFEKYILSRINNNLSRRPLVPIFGLKQIYPYMDEIKNKNDIEFLKDMLSIAFKDNYFIWFIGRNSDARSEIAKSNSDSFMWVFDQKVQNSFYLNSVDELLDIKLLQLFRLFDKSLDAALFSEIQL